MFQCTAYRHDHGGASVSNVAAADLASKPSASSCDSSRWWVSCLHTMHTPRNLQSSYTCSGVFHTNFEAGRRQPEPPCFAGPSAAPS